MNVNGCKLNNMPLILLAICCCLVEFFVGAQAQHVLVNQSPLQQQFVQPNIEYSAWSPIDVIDYASAEKTNRVRSIQSSPQLEIQSVPRGASRRNFETVASENNKQQAVTASTFRPAYKRRTFSTSTTAATPANIRVEGNANRFKNLRKNSTESRPVITRRPFTPRTTTEGTATTEASQQTPKPSPLKKVPYARGNYRPKEKESDGTTKEKEDGENYPEHFKQLLQKNKEVNTQQSDKSVLKKPVKQFKPTERTATTRPIYPTRSNRFAPKITSTSTTEASLAQNPQPAIAAAAAPVVTPKRPLRKRPRPTEKTRINIGSTLQEPPTAKTTPTYATRSPPIRQAVPLDHEINTPADELKQIDPPIREYFPRTSAAIGSSSSSLKYSSRFRNTDITGKNSNKVPSYQPTVPSITTTPTLDLNDIDLERWREILPLAAELINSDAEIMTQSPSQTVSIYEALAEILSKPTESLSFLNNKSTDRTLFSEAPTTTRQPTTSKVTTTTTTTTTTQKPTTTTTTTIKVKTTTTSMKEEEEETSKVSPSSFSSSSSPSTPMKLINNTTISPTTTSTVQMTSKSVNRTMKSAVKKTPLPSSPHTNPSSSFNPSSSTLSSFIPFISTLSSFIPLNSTLLPSSSISTSTKPPKPLINSTTISLDLISTTSTSKIPSTTSISDRLDTTQSIELITTTTRKYNNETNGRMRTMSRTRTTRSPPKNSSISENPMTRTPRLDLMTRKIARSKENSSVVEHSTLSIYPVYRPTFRMFTTTTEGIKNLSTTEIMKKLSTTTEKIKKLSTTTTELPPPTVTEFKSTVTRNMFPKTVRMKSTTIRTTSKLPSTTSEVIISTSEIPQTTTEIPQTTTSFDYDRLTVTVTEVSNPAPFRQIPKSFSSARIPANERVIPLKKYATQKESERFAILPNNMVVKLVLKSDLHLAYGALPNGQIVKMHRDGSLERVDDTTMRLEVTDIDPKLLSKRATMRENLRKFNYTTTTEQTKTENSSHILELLQKYQNETDALVKSPNIFSLAKKTHQSDEDSQQETPLEFDNELVIIDEHPEETIRTAFPTEKTDLFDFPTTPLSIDSNSVSIFPNGHDFSLSSTTLETTASTKISSDSFENEISFDDKDFKGLTLEPIPFSTEKTSTRVTSSVSSSTNKIPVYTTTKTEQPITTTESVTLPVTTENFIEKNFQVLQQLLGKTVSIFSPTSSSTTETPPSTTQSTTQRTTVSSTQKVTIPSTTPRTTPSTTSTLRTTPSTIPSTTTTRRIHTRPATSQSPRFSFTIRQTTASQSPETTTSSEIISSTSTSAIPVSTTHKFIPIEIPSQPTTNAPKRKAPFSDSDDLDFLRQLSSFINRGAPAVISTTKSLPPSTTVRSTTTTTTTTLPPTTTTTTTQRIIPSTRLTTKYSDADDVNFLKNLREYAQIIDLTTERTNLAQKILELAMNRTSKSQSFDSKQSANTNSESSRPAPFATTTTQSPVAVVSKMTDTQNNINMLSAIIEQNKNGKGQAKLSPQDIEKTKQMLEKDLVQYNKDLQLLSLLIGRPLTDKDVAKFAAANLNKPKSTTPVQTTSTTAASRTTQQILSTSPIPAFKQLTENETKFLLALQQIQTTRSTSTTSTTTEQPRVTASRSRSQEAILAELLREQGIGPTNNVNQVPIQKILLQLQAERLNRDVTTTIRPFSPMPPLRNQAPRRPIIDGLSWLWRTWQETAPGRPRQQQPSQQHQATDDLSFDDDGSQSNTDGGGGGLAFPSSNQSPFGANGFIGAAIGVTQAVTRFLGVALTGVGQLAQVALGGSSASTNSAPGPLGLFGGSRL